MTGYREAFPILHVEDVQRATRFFSSTFGFRETFRHETEGEVDVAFLELEPLGIAVARRPPDETRAFALWTYAETPEGVDEAAVRLAAAGAEAVLAPADQPWGERMCSFVDPDGTLLHVGAAR